jgi:large subunit ribosomal protein L9
MAKTSDAKTSKATKKPAGKKPGGKSAPAAPVVVRQPGVERRRNHPARAKHGFMQVLLTRAVEHVGQAGDLVKVRPGFARNYLVPQGLATFATAHNLRIVERVRERHRQLEEAKKAELRNLAAQIGQRVITIEANANPEGHLYGSVNADQIAAALRADNFNVQEENVRIEGPLKETGLYTIQISLGHDVNTEVKLWVVPTHTDEAPAAE